MSFNQFTNLDFKDLRTQIKGYLRANSNFTDFDFEGSNFSVLIDTLAYNSYITAYNTNMAVNESFIDSATLRENVVSLVRNIGYVPRSRKAAIAKINLSVDLGDIVTSTVKLSKGIVATGTISNGSYIFSIPDDITVNVDANNIASFNDIEIYEGSLLERSFLVQNDQPDAKYILPNASIDTSTIRVSIKDTITEEYSQYENIFQVNSESRLFLTQEIEDERYQLLFGDGILGKKPSNGGIITATYIVTNGLEGNGAASFSFAGKLTYGNLDTPITSGISFVTATQSSQNGAEIESIDSIKYLAPRVYASQQRAVTANDYTALIPSLFSNVDSVSAYGGEELTPPQYGKVFLTIKPKYGEFISDVTKDAIKQGLKKYTVAGIKQEFVDLSYLYVEYNSTVSYDPGQTASKTGLASNIIKAINTYAASTDINQFGGRLKYSKLLNVIDKVDSAVTSNITTIKMRRNLVPVYDGFANYELCYGNQFHADKEGFNIKSSSFRITGVNGDIFLTDFPNEDDSTKGTIKFFTIDSENNITYVNANAGSVDYVRGEILIYPVSISSSFLADRIEIEVIPESNDIVAKENLYIVLDTTANSTLNLLEDVISSGLNKSGTSYIPPSSFANTTYTR